MNETGNSNQKTTTEGLCGNASLICKICNGRFETKENLNKHIFTHSDIIKQIAEAFEVSSPPKDQNGLCIDTKVCRLTTIVKDETVLTNDVSGNDNASLETNYIPNIYFGKQNAEKNFTENLNVKYKSSVTRSSDKIDNEEIDETKQMKSTANESKTCPICFKSFTRKSGLTSHMLIHKGIKPEFCTNCGKLFRLKAHLSRHLKHCRTLVEQSYDEGSHLNNCITSDLVDVKPRLSGQFIKEISECSQNDDDLNNNNNSDSESNLGTAISDQDIASISESVTRLDEHKTAQTKKVFICKVCGLQCTHACRLKNHMRIHTNERPYLCSLCQKSFIRRDNCYKHIREVHKRDTSYRTLCVKIMKGNNVESIENLDIKDNTNVHKKNMLTASASDKFKLCSEEDFIDQAQNERKTTTFVGITKRDSNTETVHTGYCKEDSNCSNRVDDSKDNTDTKLSVGPEAEYKCVKVEVIRPPDQHTKPTKQSFVCPVCGLKCSVPSRLKVHMRIHSNKRPYSCCMCQQSFSRRDNCYSHLQKVHKQNTSYTDLCFENLNENTIDFSENSVMDGNLEEIVMTNEHDGCKEKNYKCNVCGFNTTNFRGIKIHLLNHNGAKHKAKKREFKCYICSRLFFHQGHLDRHLMCHTGEKPNHCEICNKSFWVKSDLNSHMNTHIDKYYPCEICGKKIRTLSALQTHLLAHTDDKNYICEICGKRYRWESVLQIHRQSHFERDIRCDLCNKLLSNRDYIKKHMEAHLDIRRYPCSVCNRSFRCSAHLKEHMDSHFPDQSWACKKCGKLFNRRDSMRYHMKSHSGAKPFKCEKCNQQFKRSENLRNHMLIHEGIKPHSCVTCGASFRQKVSLKRHIKRIHQQQGNIYVVQ